MKRVTVRLLCVVFLLVGTQLWSAGATKRASATSEHPFRSKLERHSASPSGTFQAEIAEISSKVAAAMAAQQSELVLHKASEAWQRLNRISGGTLKIHWDERGEVPIFIRGDRLQQPSLGKSGALSEAELLNRSMDFLKTNGDLLRIEAPESEFELMEISADPYGLTHLRYQQVYQGIEVWAHDVRVHLNAKGVVESFNGRYIPTPEGLNVNDIAVGETRARQIAREAFGRAADEVESRRLIYVDDLGTPHLTWLVVVRKGLADDWHYFVDARSGSVLKAFNDVQTDGPVQGSGVDLFDETRTLDVYEIGGTHYMINASKPMFNAAESNLPQEGKGVIYTLDARNADSSLYFITSSDPNTWNDKASVSAAANGALVYDFYNQVYGRNAIDNQGGTMNIVINFKEDFNNAFWNGQLMVFGNGDGNAFSDLAGALDVTAHEMSHGVIERSANLVYENQPGALNESFADVFGALFEFWVEGDDGDWLLGEDVTTPNTPGDALRNMEDPGAANVAFNGQQPTKMSEFRNLPNTPEGDNGGVHINSGIPNRAFYLFATSPDVGRDRAGEVYYQALTQYLTRNSQFIDCRLAVIKAIDDVFTDPAQADAAKNAAAAAFDAVEIFEGDPTPPPPTQPPVQGEEFLAVIDAVTGNLFRYTISDASFLQLTSRALFSRPAVTDDGSFIFYVDDETNLHLLASDGTSDQQLTSGGGFNNVAISPNGRYLAATSTFVEPVLYVFDLQDASGAGDKQIQLYTPTYTEGTSTGNILFPDRIDWATDNQTVMYDAFNIVVSAAGDTTGYWDINLVDTESEGIIRLFPPQPPGVDIGNAVFASNTDNIIAFDYVDENRDVTVLAVNLITGDIGQVTFNFGSLASPTFSKDDTRIYYHYIDQEGASIWQVDLLEDGITGAGNDAQIITGGVFPVDFAIGERPTDVEEDPRQTLPTDFTLQQNYPNPFNPQTTIRYELPTAGDVTLSIFDIRGREVRVLERQRKTAGTYQTPWDGKDRDGKPVASGIYFYRLEVRTSDGNVHRLARKMTLLR